MNLSTRLRGLTSYYRELFTSPSMLPMLLGAAIATFGIYNIHEQSQITEGGILGLILLIFHWTGVYPSFLVPILDGISYLIAFRVLGKEFLKRSVVATISFTLFFKLWERFPPVLPNLLHQPLLAALLGGLFVGVGCGLIMRQGASGAGDDALAMSISTAFRCRISHAYLFTDLSVLLLSLSYIPITRIGYSLLSVLLSSYTIELIQNIGKARV